MPTLVSHQTYEGIAPEITLVGGSSTSDRVLIVVGWSAGDGSVASDITVGGVSATILGTDVLYGGVEASLSVAEIRNPGAGAFSTSITNVVGSITANRVVWNVYEFSDAGIALAASFSSATSGGVSIDPFAASVTAINALSETIIVTGLASEGADESSSVVDDASLLSFVSNLNPGGALFSSGYKTASSVNESIEFTWSTFASPGGNVDRITMAVITVPDYVAQPLITLSSALTPGATITATMEDFSAAPTQVVIEDSLGNTITRSLTLVSGNDYTFTMPALPSVGSSSASVLFGNVTVSATEGV